MKKQVKTQASESPKRLVITKEVVGKLLEANFGNLVRKIKSGKPLTQSEMAQLADAQVDKGGKPAGQNVARSIRDAAAQLGLPLGVLVMARAAGCPAFRQDGRVDKPVLVQWLKDNPHRIPDADAMVDKLQWDAREKRARAEMREHRLALARREVIPAREMRREFTRAVVDMKKRLLEGMRTNAQEICLRLAANNEQITWAVDKAEARSRQILTEFAKGEWASDDVS
jgi:hypothetical protein